VSSDISAIAAALPGARYSVVTFDQASRVRLPLTTDTTALDAAVETLLPESYEVSRGTSVSEAKDRLKELLQQADTRTPERGRIVYYLGDGEQTAADAPAPFAIDKRLINGGAVLGYGTTAGGRMKATRSRFDTSRDYIKDPATGEDARSVVSEPTLRTIADQLGLAYVHREAGDAIGPVVDGIDLERFGTSDQIEKQKVIARRELYWPLLIGVAGIAAWEVGAGVAALVQTRRRKVARS
jgi:Ca-activated chloride channel family protein